MKYIYIFILLLIVGCSADSSEETIEVTAYNYELADIHPLGYVFKFDACIKNNSGNAVSGDVVFKIKSMSGHVYMHVKGYNCQNNDTQCIGEVNRVYFQTTNLDIEEVYFK